MDLIEKLKAKYPELQEEPMMDELDAMFESEEDMEMDMEAEEEAPMDPIDMEFEDEEMEEDEEF
jgi:hypothetical protein